MNQFTFLVLFCVFAVCNSKFKYPFHRYRGRSDRQSNPFVVPQPIIDFWKRIQQGRTPVTKTILDSPEKQQTKSLPTTPKADTPTIFNGANQITTQLTASTAEIEKGVTNHDIKVILQKHNQLRTKLANGEVPGQPQGINFKTMKWDKQLAKKAQEIAETCVFRHVDVHDDRWPVGQNLRTTRSSKLHKGADWNTTVQKWFDEHELYTYGNKSIKRTGHYTQVVWDTTELVGCGYTLFETDKDGPLKYQQLYVCNYGPSGNIKGRPPYKTKDCR